MVKLIIPDLGGASDVTIIEILVKPGDRVELDQSILTLEGEKATMEVPATQAGAIAKILVNVGDKVNVGDVVAELDVDDVPVIEDKVISDEVADEVPSKDEPTSPTAELKTLNVPDLGGADSAQVIECLVNVGDEISIDQPVITLEGEKATMEVPSTEAGEIKKIHLQVGDQIKQGQPMIDVLTLNSASTTLQAPQASEEAQVSQPQQQPTVKQTSPTTTTTPVVSEPLPSFDKVYAGPSVRRYAREFGIDLNQIKGTGHKGRIQKEDLIQLQKVLLYIPDKRSK